MPTHKLISGKLLPVLLAAIVVSGCRRPPASEGGVPENVPAPATASDGSSPDLAAGRTDDLPLSLAVARILARAQRTGSIVEGCRCGPRGRMVEMHSIPRTLIEQPMETALNGIKERHPQIKWSYSGRGLVRVTDSSQTAGLMKVRIQEFLVIEDRPPQTSLPALWRTPEVSAYMRKHSLRFMNTAHAGGKLTKTAPTVIQTKNATVAEILDRMVESYRSGSGQPLYRGWVYRECRSGAETIAEIAMF